MTKSKQCNKCEKLMSTKNFHVDRRAKDGYKNVCKACLKKRRDEKKKEREEKVKSLDQPAVIKEAVIKDMKDLGIYEHHYDNLIDIYVDLRYQYEVLTMKFEESGFRYWDVTKDGTTKKTAVVTTLEALRKDLLQYSDRLGLTPKANNQNATSNKRKDNVHPFISRGMIK